MRLTTALGRALHVTPPTTIRGLLNEFGGTGEAARLFTGQPPSSRLYTNAQRNFQRYYKGERHPSAGTMEELRRIFIRRRRALLRRGAQVTISGRIIVSKDSRRRTIQGSLSAGAMNRLLDLWDGGDRPAAADWFQVAFGRENMGGQFPQFVEVDFLRIEPG